MDVVDIERAILSTFLFANDLDDDLSKVYELDISFFTSPFRKRVAEKINEVQDGAYGFLSYKIEESIEGTQFEMEWLNILAQNSLGLGYSKRYYDAQLDKKIKGDLCRQLT